MFSHRRNTLTDLGTPLDAAGPQVERVLLRRAGDPCAEDPPASVPASPPTTLNLHAFARGRLRQSPAPGSAHIGSTARGGTGNFSSTASSNPAAGAVATRGRTNGRAARAGGVPSGVTGALHGSPGRHRLPPQWFLRRRGMFDPSSETNEANDANEASETNEIAGSGHKRHRSACTAWGDSAGRRRPCPRGRTPAKLALMGEGAAPGGA